MPESLVPWGSTFAAWVAVGGLAVLQALVADVAGIRAGHVPGMPVTVGHDAFLFRAVRAHANTNESLATFAVLSLAAVLAGAPAAWTNGLAWTFVGARVAHMLAYWADRRALRSASFAVSMVALVGLVVVAGGALAG